MQENLYYFVTVHAYAPINVNPGREGGVRANCGDFLSGPRVGIFDRLTLISENILKKPEPIFSRTQSMPVRRLGANLRTGIL